MGFGFRKSKSFGGVRFNLSKSGLGVSYGVKGFRISQNSKETTLYAGRGGVYYRKKLSTKKKQPSQNKYDETQLVTPYHTYMKLNEVQGIFEYYVHINKDYVLNDFIKNQKQIQNLKNLNYALMVIGCFAPFLWLICAYLFYIINKKQKDNIININEEKLKEVKTVFDELSNNYCLYNAFVHHRLSWGLIEVSNMFNTSLPVIILHDRDYKLCFCENSLVVYNNETVFAIPYKKIVLMFEETTALMINPPEYSNVLSITYEHTNKDGSPNKRYKYNQEIKEISAYLIQIISDNDIFIPLTMFDKEKAFELYKTLENLMKKRKS